MITISKQALGTPQHLCQRTPGGDVEWVEIIAKESWIWGADYDTTKNLIDIFKIKDIKMPELIPSAQRMALSELNIEEHSIQWHKTMRQDDFSTRLKNALDTMWKALEALSMDGYRDTYVLSSSVMKSMSQATLDVELYQKYLNIEKNPTIRSTLLSFKPTGTIAPRVIYDQTSTNTGRLIVRHGPRILTLPVRMRDIIKSSSPTGIVMEIDYVSIEPRIALMTAGKSCAGDIYKHISQELFGGILTRKETKIATLCALYGVSQRKLREVVDTQIPAKEIIYKVRKYFDFETIVRGLCKELSEKGHILNMFGRPVFIDGDAAHLVYNNFVQSSAVDAAMVGFYIMLDKAINHDIHMRPLFLIHDAMIVDMDKKNVSSLNRLFKNGVFLKELGHLPVDIDVLAN